MRKVLVVVLLLLGAVVFGQGGRGPQFSGVFDSTVNFTAGAGGAANSWGLEEYANIRLRAQAGENGFFHAAFNVSAFSGNYLAAASGAAGMGGFVSGANYAAAMESERLYFRYNGEAFDAELGLLRLAFGYGQAWGSSDFLNPRNPLFPDARPRGVLGTGFYFYPSDELKILLFGAAPRDPSAQAGGGFLPGFSVDQHWERGSLQFLYAYETPKKAGEWGLHRFGLSLKADLELGLIADTLYALDPSTPIAKGIDGLSAGAGFDYSFYDGKFYVLAEYLFNGPSSSTALSPENLAGFTGERFLYWAIRYGFNDYTYLSLSEILSFSDLSFSPILTLDYDLFQGLTLTILGQAFLDRADFPGGGGKGELGPESKKTRLFISARARLRF
jgi:hypothetical protein